ncbi:MAG: substrate-binding domain-containing protein [Acidimicrobiia bacterium]
MHVRKPATWTALALALMLFGAACGGGDDNNEAGSGDEGNTEQTQTAAGGEELSGTINISGSSTVAPITTRVAELFKEEQSGVDVNVDGPGTGDGFVLFCNGETDISDASRAIKKAEADACTANGIEFIELKIGIDGLTLMTSPENTAVECLSFADLYALIGPESQGKKKWTDASALAKELKSTTTFPAGLDLTVVGPGEESGTYDSFVELALEPTAKKRAEAGKIEEDQIKTSRPDYQSSADDNIIIQGIEGAKGSLGWVGFAYAEEQGDKVKEVKVSKEPGGECVAPDTTTIASAKYPLSRYLYIYVNAKKATENEAMVPFVDFYLGDGIGAVTEVKYVALADTDLTATKGIWSAKTVGTRDGGK